MRIVNNRIYIARGETPTYSANVIDKDTGAPFIIDKSIAMNKDDNSLRRVLIEFVVRDSAYDRGNNHRIRKHLILGRDVSYHLFDDIQIASYNDLGYIPEFVDGKIIWDDNIKPKVGNENRLHRYDHDGESFYVYYNGSKWVDYEFGFNVTFTYDETSVMEPKTYQYEITLFTGNQKDDVGPGEIPITIEYKKPLLGLTDFIVEGSISE
jgi:hypothetical protein